MDGMEITRPFTDGPAWLDSMVFSRDGNTIIIQAVRKSGTLLGEVRFLDTDFNRLADLLLTR